MSEEVESEFIYGTPLAKLSGRINSGFIHLIIDFHDCDSEILSFPIEAKQNLIEWLLKTK